MLLKSEKVYGYFVQDCRLRNSLPIECFPLTYDLSGFKSRINRHLLTVVFLNRIPVCFNLFALLFVVTPCLVVVIQPCMSESQLQKKDQVKFILHPHQAFTTSMNKSFGVAQ